MQSSSIMFNIAGYFLKHNSNKGSCLQKVGDRCLSSLRWRYLKFLAVGIQKWGDTSWIKKQIMVFQLTPQLTQKVQAKKREKVRNPWKRFLLKIEYVTWTFYTRLIFKSVSESYLPGMQFNWTRNAKSFHITGSLSEILAGNI